MRTTAVVLGGYGFIGRHVCRALDQQGITVYSLGHGQWPEREQRSWGVSRWIGDDIDLDSLTRAVGDDQIHSFIHCAGSGSVAHSYASPLVDYQRSVSSVAMLLEFARKMPNRPRVVITSSAAVYGDQGDVDLAESAIRSPVSPYGFHKMLAENLCDSYARFFDVPTTVVRLFSVYGDGLRKQLLWDAACKFRDGSPRFFGTGHELRDWIQVEDAAALLCTASKEPGHRTGLQIYNGGHDKATTREVLAILGGCFGDAPEPVFTGEIHAGNPQRMTADSGHAERQLGWQPVVPLAVGLRRYADWFKSAQRL